MNPWTCFDVTMDGAVAHVRMNQPQRHNAMTPAFWAEVPRLFRQLDAAGGVRAAVLSSEGRHFSAGMDLSVFANAGTLGTVDVRAREQFRQQLSFARVQAVSLGTVVTVCPRLSQQCDGRWTDTPVQIFHAAQNSAVLKHVDALKPDHRLSYNRAQIEFRADGSLNALQNGTFIYCVAQYRWHVSLSISQSGRSQLEWHEQPCPH